MVKINKIYTRKGDDGSTGLMGSARVGKDSDRVTAYGTVDELNAFVAVARQYDVELDEEDRDLLLRTQSVLFDLGALLAVDDNADMEMLAALPALEGVFVEKLERRIDTLTERVPELRSFVLPGGSGLNAYLHVCRTVCRRAEREVVFLARAHSIPEQALPLLNRLSDYFFALSREAIRKAKGEEVLWVPGSAGEETSS